VALHPAAHHLSTHPDRGGRFALGHSIMQHKITCSTRQTARARSAS
jgi:hypothetical protein